MYDTLIKSLHAKVGKKIAYKPLIYVVVPFYCCLTLLCGSVVLGSTKTHTRVNRLGLFFFIHFHDVLVRPKMSQDLKTAGPAV